MNTILCNLEYGWYIRDCCRQWQKLSKWTYPVIVLAWGAAWPDCRPVKLWPRSDSCSGAAVSVQRPHCTYTDGLSRYLWPPFWWSYVPAKAVHGDDRSFDRLPVKYPVHFGEQNEQLRDSVHENNYVIRIRLWYSSCRQRYGLTYVRTKFTGDGGERWKLLYLTKNENDLPLLTSANSWTHGLQTFHRLSQPHYASTHLHVFTAVIIK